MTHRTFIAIDLPPSHSRHIVRLQKRLTGLNLPVTWEDTGQLHLTLNFLGMLTDDQLSRLPPLLETAASRTSGFSLTPAFLETLYRRHDRSLIYLGLTGDLADLTRLQRSLNQFMSRLSLPAQTRFLPHITIGKLVRTDPTATKRYLDAVSDFKFSPLPPFTVDRISLYESFPSRSGSTYRKIRSFPLS